MFRLILIAAPTQVDAAADQARIKKDAAVAEGKADVEEAKATTASYLDHARSMVGTALDKAQQYVAAGQERLGATTTHSTAHVRNTGSEGPKSSGFTNTLTGAAVSALETTKGMIATAQAQLAATGQGVKASGKPHVEPTHTATQPHVDSAEVAKQAPSNPVISASTPNMISGATGTPKQVSPSTISYPAEPKTEVHHVTTEGGAPPPEKVDDKVVDKIADELTSTKITDVSAATTAH